MQHYWPIRTLIHTIPLSKSNISYNKTRKQMTESVLGIIPLDLRKESHKHTECQCCITCSFGVHSHTFDGCYKTRQYALSTIAVLRYIIILRGQKEIKLGMQNSNSKYTIITQHPPLK